MKLRLVDKLRRRASGASCTNCRCHMGADLSSRSSETPQVPAVESWRRLPAGWDRGFLYLGPCSAPRGGPERIPGCGSVRGSWQRRQPPDIHFGSGDPGRPRRSFLAPHSREPLRLPSSDRARRPRSTSILLETVRPGWGKPRTGCIQGLVSGRPWAAEPQVCLDTRVLGFQDEGCTYCVAWPGATR